MRATALGATYTWDGGGADNNITTAQNWVGDIVPTANSDVIWAGTLRLNVNVDAGGPGRSFTFASGAGAFIISGAASSVSSGIVNNSTNLQTMNVPLTLTGAQTFSAATGNFAFGGTTLANGGFLLTLDGTKDTSISNVISGSGGLTKTNTGTLTLTGVNTYTGATTIDGGIIAANNASSLGATSGVTINAGTLEATATFSTNRTFTLSNAASTFQVDPGMALTVTSVIGGTGVLNKTGAGTMVLSGNNTYNGGTVVSAGTLRTSANERIANAGDLTVSGGIFDVQTFSETVHNVTLSSGSLTGTGAGTLTGSTFALQSGTASVILAGAGATLTKTTGGTVTLTGTNTFTGATTVSAGTLTLAGSSGSALGSTSSVTVNSGGTLLLGASDQIKNTAPMTLAGGTFAKGNFNEGAAGAPGVGALTLTAAGSHIDFGTGTVGVLTFASLTPGTFKLTIDNWTGTANIVGVSGSTDRLIFNSDQSANLSSFQFTGFTAGAVEFNLGGGYFEVVPATVPETSTWVAAAIGLVVAGLHLVRRRRALKPAPLKRG